MKKYLLVFFLILSGCSFGPDYLVYPNNERIKVTAGYKFPGKEKGDEFVFSTVLPDDEWSYYAKGKEYSYGYLSPFGRKSRKEIMVEWIWINKQHIGTQQTIRESPFYLPWYSDVKGDGGRIPYIPTENQLRYGDWHRGGYPQMQFYQTLYKGKQKFYCVRAVTRSGGYTKPPEEYTAAYFAQIREGLYGVYDTCPFRTTDGRDAYFKVTAHFNVSNDDIATNPAIIDDNLKALDEWLKPIWDSLEITPIAYQFDPPSSKQ